MVRSPASGRPCTRRFRLPKPNPHRTANSGAASGPTAAGAASSRRRPRLDPCTIRSSPRKRGPRQVLDSRDKRVYARLQRAMRGNERKRCVCSSRFALATPSTISVLRGARRGRRTHALLERSLQISRPVVFAQQVAKGLVSELLQRLHRVAPKQIQGLPGLLVEFHELAPSTGRLLGHDDLLRWNNRRAGSFIARGCDGPTETRSAYTLPGRESARG